jgi:hypothetical protein
VNTQYDQIKSVTEPNDLNTIHVAVMALPFEQLSLYNHHLEQLGRRAGNPFPLSTADASQCAEALRLATT